MPIGLPELLIVLFIVLLILGPKRLPALGKSVGGGMRSFKDAITSRSDSEDDPEVRPLPAAEPSGLERDEDGPLQGEVVSERRP